MKAQRNRLRATLLIFPFALSACFSGIDTPSKEYHYIKDQHIIFHGFAQKGNHLNFYLSSCYDLESVSYRCELFDEEGYLVDTIRESNEVSSHKNVSFAITCPAEVETSIETVRFFLSSGKTHETPDDDFKMPEKEYYYDYMAKEGSESRLIGTEKLSYGATPSKKYSAPDYGPYAFKSWAYFDYDDSKTKSYNYDVSARCNLMIYPDYSYRENDHLSVLINREDSPCNSVVRTKRAYYKNVSGVPVEQASQQGNAVIYKKSGSKYYLVSSAYCFLDDSSYDKTEDTVRIDSKTYTATLLKRDFENTGLAIFTINSTENLTVAKFASSSNVGSDFKKISQIAPNNTSEESMYIQLMDSNGHDQVRLPSGTIAQMLAYKNPLSGATGSGIFDCNNGLIAIDIVMNGTTGYGTPIETIQKFII